MNQMLITHLNCLSQINFKYVQKLRNLIRLILTLVINLYIYTNLTIHKNKYIYIIYFIFDMLIQLLLKFLKCKYL